MSDDLRALFPNEDARGGVVGVVLVLLEEDQVTDHGARAGYAALADFVQKEINQIIPTLNIAMQDVGDEVLDTLIDKAVAMVHDAIAEVQSPGENFWSWVDGDNRIGFKLLTFKHDALANNHWDISQRFQRFGT